MFKYLWIVVIFALYIWWVVKAIQGIINGIKFTKKYHKRFKLDYCADETIWFIFIHATAILACSVIEFVFYYLAK